jgi:hypothetical protein
VILLEMSPAASFGGSNPNLSVVLDVVKEMVSESSTLEKLSCLSSMRSVLLEADCA